MKKLVLVVLVLTFFPFVSRAEVILESFGLQDANKNGLLGDTITGRVNNYSTSVGGENNLILGQEESETETPLFFTWGTSSTEARIGYRLDSFLSTFRVPSSQPINVFLPWGGTYQFGNLSGDIHNIVPTQSLPVISPNFGYNGSDSTQKACRDYAGVSSIYFNPDYTLDLFVHCEYHKNAPDWTTGSYWSVVLYSYDGAYHAVAPIITSYDKFDPNSAQSFYGAGLPNSIRMGDYVYVYFVDYHYSQSERISGESIDNVVVARAPIQDRYNPGAWKKFYRGGWSSPANSNPFSSGSGLASGVFFGNYPGTTDSLFGTEAASVSYNNFTKNYMAMVQGYRYHNGVSSDKGVYASFSNDGLYWSEPRIVMNLQADENYPTAVNYDTGETAVTGQSFKLVYSKNGIPKYRPVTLSRISASETQCNLIDDNGNGVVDEGICSSAPPPNTTSTPPVNTTSTPAPIPPVATSTNPNLGLQDQINKLLKQIADLQAQIAVKSGGSTKPTFSRNLRFGLRGDSDVKALQEVLTKRGLYSGPITGNFFSLTLRAVKDFQIANGIQNTGFVGPLTRNKLNSIN